MHSVSIAIFVKIKHKNKMIPFQPSAIHDHHHEQIGVAYHVHHQFLILHLHHQEAVGLGRVY